MLELQSAATAASRRVVVRHATRYQYDRPIQRSQHRIHLPAMHDWKQNVRSFRLQITPEAPLIEYEDVFGNWTARFEIDQPYSELTLVAESEIELLDVDPFAFAGQPIRPPFPLSWMPWEQKMLVPYLTPIELPETQLTELYDYAMSFVERNQRDLMETLFNINLTLFREFKYLPGATTVETTPFEVMTHKRGVCQDFANLFICLARLLGIPARYVCGYVYTGNEQSPVGDASHAWLQLYIPNIGWKGFDPTNGKLPTTDHVRWPWDGIIAIPRRNRHALFVGPKPCRSKSRSGSDRERQWLDPALSRRKLDPIGSGPQLGIEAAGQRAHDAIDVLRRVFGRERTFGIAKHQPQCQALMLFGQLRSAVHVDQPQRLERRPGGLAHRGFDVGVGDGHRHHNRQVASDRGLTRKLLVRGRRGMQFEQGLQVQLEGEQRERQAIDRHNLRIDLPRHAKNLVGDQHLGGSARNERRLRRQAGMRAGANEAPPTGLRRFPSDRRSRPPCRSSANRCAAVGRRRCPPRASGRTRERFQAWHCPAD